MNIAVVNDSPAMVEVLRRTIERKTGHRVVWVAYNGVEAIEACIRETPDLLLMDLMMPGMSGVEATRRIMATAPCAILIVTVNTGANTLVFEAMGCGALDVVETPALEAGSDSGAPLLAKIELLGRLIGESPAAARGRATRRRKTPPGRNTLLAIGASAGGPAALASVLANLHRDFMGAVVIVQHINEEFAATLASWLNETSALPVRVAVEGDRPTPGTALLASGTAHLIFKTAARLGYTLEPRESSYRPSIDTFFVSAARSWRGGIVGVLLTGMGRDGAAGLRRLREVGNYTLSQDRASSAVYGMPKAAAELDAAVEVLPLVEMAPRLNALFASAALETQAPYG